MSKRKLTQSQPDRFIEKARELGCDESESAFEERLRKIAKAEPPNEQKPKKPKTSSKKRA